MKNTYKKLFYKKMEKDLIINLLNNISLTDKPKSKLIFLKNNFIYLFLNSPSRKIKYISQTLHNKHPKHRIQSNT